MILFTPLSPVLLLDEARDQVGELQEISNSEQRAPLADDGFWIGCDHVGPLTRHRADLIVIDAQEEPRPVPVVPFADADELPSAERVEGVGHAHKARARVRRACNSW